MEINLSVLELLTVLGKFTKFRIQQFLAATNNYEIVNTSFGQVKGRQRKAIYGDHFYAFEGIPYAKPPLGELRFRAPRPPEPWQGVLNCTSCKSKPMQYNYLARIVEGSEDCLYLNVYTKKLKTEKLLPVMVWIYGGGFSFGEGSRDFYSPDYFMQRDMVLVTFNYRLSAFGFLCFDDPDLNIPGNAALKDQVLALRWVKQNIHNFNGDPNNITVFGQSAGAASAHIMTLTPQAEGLFHKVILQSGTVHCQWAHSKDHKLGYKFARYLGYNGDESDKSVYEYLSQQSSRKLTIHDLKLLTNDDLERHIYTNFIPVIEPYITDDCITNKPFRDLLPNAWGNEIPHIIGANGSEGLLFSSLVEKYPYLINDLGDFTWALPSDLPPSYSDGQLKELAGKLKEVYFDGQQPNANDNARQYFDLCGDQQYWHGISRTIKARRKYANKVPTYCYYFTFDSEFFNHFRQTCSKNFRGAAHSDEVSYLFYFIVSEKLDTSSKEYRCIQRMIGMWYNFALKSNPNCKEIKPVKWHPTTSEVNGPIKCLEINDKLSYRRLPFADKLKVWDGFYTKDCLI